jgi:hypothetical protein
MFTLSTVIGYYVHHQGRGHLHRAVAIAAFAATDITGLSTHPRPAGWLGDWVELDDDAGAGPEADPGAGGRLHYAPYAHDGLRSRMAALATWIANARPDALVVDVSVEVALLARLHGVPVLTMAQPGRRQDTPHTLGYAISDQILAPWPAVATQIWHANSGAVAGKVHCLGAISRFPVAREQVEPTPGSVLVLNGTGGRQLTPEVDRARAATPAWDWVHLGGPGGPWSEDPWPLLRTASVIVSHCGQSALADISAARRPAVLIPQARPFREQSTTAVALRRLGVPALVLDNWPAPHDWPALLEAAEALDGRGWSVWNDGDGAARAAEVLERVAVDASRALA